VRTMSRNSHYAEHMPWQSTSIMKHAISSSPVANPARFVTRLADKYQNKNKRRSSMYNSARALDLPDAFVEIRHQITHGDLPSLVVLRNYAKRALSWLWQHYWSTINVHKTGVLLPSPVFNEGEEAVQKGLREALREYRDLSVQAIKKDPKKFRELRGNLPTETSLEVFRMCRGDLEAIRALCKVFLERKMLIPSSTTYVLPHSLQLQNIPTQYSLESNVQGAFDIWDALLKNLSLHNRDFFPLLVHEMFSVLGAPSMLDVRRDEVREALYEWMMHFLTSEEWRHPRSGHAIIGSTLNACIMTQNYWTRKLLINVAIKSKDAAIKSQYGRLAKQAIESCTGARAAPEGELPDDSSSEEEDEEEGSVDEKVYDPADDILGEDLECLASQGWKLADNWAPTPFGTQPAFPLFST
jgi:ribosomal biogenesis protein LAS1